MTVIPYAGNTWVDGSGGGTPISAGRLGVMETGIKDAHYQPAVRVFHNVAQSITNSTDTALAFNSERFDQVSNAASNMHDTVTNNSRLTCRYAGVYSISAAVEWAGNSTGVRILKIRHQGTTFIAENWAPSGTSAAFSQTINTLYALAVNEYIELVVNQNSGGALNVNATGNYSPEFMMVRVG